MPKPEPEPLKISFQQEGQTLVAAIPSDVLVQAAHVDQLCAQVDRVIDKAPAGTSMLLSFGQVRYMSSIFIGRLIAFQKKLARQDGRLMLCDLNDDLSEVMRHAKLEKFIAIYPNAAAALESKTFSWSKLLGRKKGGG